MYVYATNKRIAKKKALELAKSHAFGVVWFPIGKGYFRSVACNGTDYSLSNPIHFGELNPVLI